MVFKFFGEIERKIDENRPKSSPKIYQKESFDFDQ